MKKLLCLMTALMLLFTVTAYAADTNGWTCSSCGQTGNTGNYCGNCGAKKPNQTWTCASCGQTGNTGNFCTNCGKAAASSESTAFTGLQVQTTMRLATRSGPGGCYTEPGSFLTKGQTVTVLSRMEYNEAWWVQVEFRADGRLIRAYTGKKRISISDALWETLPVESPLRDTTLSCSTECRFGPGTDYALYTTAGTPEGRNALTLYAGLSVTVWAEENGWSQIEFLYNGEYRNRAWVPSGCLW